MPYFSAQSSIALYERLTSHLLAKTPTIQEGGTLNQLVVNLSEGCNLACTYCFANEGLYGKKHKSWMSPDMGRKIVAEFIDIHSAIKTVKFFGGEPLLNIEGIRAVCETFDEAVNEQKIAFAPRYNAITNGTIATPKALDVVRHWKINLTVSIDGPQSIHDFARKLPNGKGSFELVDRNIPLLLDGGCQIRLLEAVYTPIHLAMGMSMLDVYRYLRERYPSIATVVVHPLRMNKSELHANYDGDLAKRYETGIQESSQELFDHVFEALIDEQRFEFLHATLSELSHPQKSDKLCDVGTSSVTVSSQGIVYPCYVFSDKEDFVLGRVGDDGLYGRQHVAKGWQALQALTRDQIPACQGCDIKRTCHHCLIDAGSDAGISSNLPDVECAFQIAKTEAFLQTLNKAAGDRSTFSTFSAGFKSFCERVR